MTTYQILRLLILLLSLGAGPIFSQDDEKSTLIGGPNSDERTMNVVADNVGNTFVGGRMDNKGLIVKQNSLQVVQWSKLLTYTSNPADEVSIAFLDVIGDTVFGCGKIHQTTLGIGSFYFKMNAQTGTLYWSKCETSGPNYFSVMRYANGRFFLVGGEYGTNQRARVMAVSSQTGNILWQTPCINYVFPSTATNFHVSFLGATEMVNGKMFITGSAEGFNNGSLATSVPVLVGISELGNIFINRYFAFPQALNNDYMGSRIEYDSDLNLILGIYSRLGTLGGTNAVFLKCDTLASVLYSKFYPISPTLVQSITSLNETATGYTLYGWYNSAIDGMYAMNVSKNGNLEKCVSITKPNGYYIPFWYSKFVMGNSSFVNGYHYFPATESSSSIPDPNINQIILDENLDFAGDCSELTEIFPPTLTVPTYVNFLGPALAVNPLTVSNGGILQDHPLFIPCSDVSLNLGQTPHCDQADVFAVTTGFSNPTFYWSNGTSGNSDTITVGTMDTIFVRVLDIKCCELIDTIIPSIVPSSFTMSLPADTTICLQQGNSFTISPGFSGVNTPIHYLWSNNTTGLSLNITQSGIYWVDVSDDCSTKRDSIVITVNSLPVIGNNSNVLVCEGNFPITLNPTVSAGASVLWDDGTTTVNRTVNNPGSYIFSATNMCGTVNAVISVLQTDLPDIQLIPLVDTCIQNGSSVQLVSTATGAAAISWSNGSTGNQLTVFVSGNYTVYGSNSCGIDSATSSVTINHFPELDLPATLDTCFEIGVGFFYTALGSGGTYQWSSGSQAATEWISQEGVYSCTLTNQCGSITDSMQVRRLTAVDLYFPEDSIRDCQRQLSVSLLHIETNYNLEVYAPNGDLAGTHLSESGWYLVHASNACGEKWDSIYVNLQNEQFFYLPNSFTPNGDLNNDRFEFKGENVIIREIRVFNRWGEEIFTENGKFTGWDGKYQGEGCPDGIYAVHVIYEDCFGIPTEFNGHVNLLR